jgi:hypothetical protein
MSVSCAELLHTWIALHVQRATTCTPLRAVLAGLVCTMGVSNDVMGFAHSRDQWRTF